MPNKPIASKKKRLLIMLPVFLLPFALIGYLIFTVVKKKETPTAAITTGAFNTKLPSPNLQTGEKNKLEIYLDAQKDSLKRKQQLNEDPNTRETASTVTSGKSSDFNPFSLSRKDAPLPGKTTPADPNERKVNDRLAQLYAVLKSAPDSSKQALSSAVFQAPPLNTNTSKLEKIMADLHQRDTEANPQLQQVNTMLDKLDRIVSFQHSPNTSTAHGGSTSPSGSGAVFLVTTKDSSQVDGGETPSMVIDNGNFYGLDDEAGTVTPETGTIQAVVHETQVITNGSSVKLRLLQDIYINGQKIPQASFIYGKCSLSTDRVIVQLTSAEYANQIFPIAMKLYDGADGLEGLNIRGGASLDIAKESMTQGMGAIGLTSLDPSLAAQATAAGIETAKSLLSHKVRIIHFTLKAGHKVLLKAA